MKETISCAVRSGSCMIRPCPVPGMRTLRAPGTSSAYLSTCSFGTIQSSSAPTTKRRHLQPREPPRQLRVVVRRPGEAREAGHLAVGVHDVVEVRAVGEVVEVFGLPAAEEAGGDALRRHGEEVDERLAGHVEAGGRDQREALDPSRVVDRDIRGDPASDREADEVEAVETQRVGEVSVVEDEIVEAHAPLGRLGLAEAGMLGRDEVDGSGHLLVERQPHARAAGAVQEDRGLPDTLAAVGHAHVADVDPLRLGVEEPGSRHGCRALGHRASSRRRSRRSGARSYSTSWSTSLSTRSDQPRGVSSF